MTSHGACGCCRGRSMPSSCGRRCEGRVPGLVARRRGCCCAIGCCPPGPSVLPWCRFGCACGCDQRGAGGGSEEGERCLGVAGWATGVVGVAGQDLALDLVGLLAAVPAG